MTSLDLHALQLFLDVSELGSVSKAAARHGLAQPSVTSRLQKLERQLGVELLERTATGSTPSSIGAQLAANAAEVLAAADGFVHAAAMLAAPEQKNLAIAATSGVVRYYLPRWLSSNSLGGVHLEVSEATTVRVAALVRSGAVVLGYLDGPAAPLGLRSIVVATHELVAVGAPSHPVLRQRRKHTPNSFVNAPLIGQSPESGTRDCIEAALSPFGFTGFSREVATADEARLAAIGGAGIAILPHTIVRDDLEAGRVHRVGLQGVGLHQPVRAAWRGTRPAENSARALLDASLDGERRQGS